MGPYLSEEKFNWFSPLVFILPLHVIPIFGIFFYPPTFRLLSLTIFVFFLIQGIGITLGYHRCLTHRSLEFRFKGIEYLFATFGCLGLQKGPLWWCSIHRLHHQNSDTLHDPHNSKKGFLYSHFLWLAHLDPRWKNLLSDFREYQFKVEDLSSDPYYRWLDRYWYLPWFIFLGVLFILGRFSWVVWGGFVPFLYHYHSTWIVNSLCHKYGYRSFETKPLSDQSTNNWFSGIFSFGEGWHNNHHAFPSSAKHGFFRWWEFDMTYVIIWVLNKLGLISKLVIPTPETVKLKILNLLSIEVTLQKSLK